MRVNSDLVLGWNEVTWTNLSAEDINGRVIFADFFNKMLEKIFRQIATLL